MFKHTIDLTHTLSSQAPSFDDDEKFAAHPVADYERNGYFAQRLSLPEHFATHFDAPAHFSRGSWTVDEVPAERLIRPVAILDVSQKAKDNPDYLVSLQDIADWEQAHGHIPVASVIMAYTGWEKRWNSPKTFRNQDEKGVRHFPGYSLEAARFLVEAREAVGLGIDTLSVDTGSSTDFPVHRYASAHGVYHVEGVANLQLVPPTGALLLVAPAKVQGGSGAPVRVMAIF